MTWKGTVFSFAQVSARESEGAVKRMFYGTKGISGLGGLFLETAYQPLIMGCSLSIVSWADLSRSLFSSHNGLKRANTS